MAFNFLREIFLPDNACSINLCSTDKFDLLRYDAMRCDAMRFDTIIKPEVLQRRLFFYLLITHIPFYSAIYNARIVSLISKYPLNFSESDFHRNMLNAA